MSDSPGRAGVHGLPQRVVLARQQRHLVSQVGARRQQLRGGARARARRDVVKLQLDRQINGAVLCVVALQA